MFMHKNADNIMIWKGEQYEKNYYDQPQNLVPAAEKSVEKWQSVLDIIIMIKS